jgi:hypothetical protein
MCASRRNPSEPAEPPAVNTALDGRAGPNDVVVHRVHDELIVRGQLTERGLARGAMVYDQAIDAEPGYGQVRNVLLRGVRRRPRGPELVQQFEATLNELQNLRHEMEERDNRLQEANSRLRAENQRLHRALGLLVSLVVSVGIILACRHFGFSLWVTIAAFVGLIAIGLEGAKWLRDPDVSASRFIFAMAAAIAWALLAGILGVLLSSSAAPHPARTPGSRPAVSVFNNVGN